MQAELKGTIFHFNCPICGAHPQEQELIPYLDSWEHCPKKKLESLINMFWRVLGEILHGDLTAKRNKLSAALKHELGFVNLIIQCDQIDQYENPLIKSTDGKLIVSFDCPFCDAPAGPRSKERYFSKWPEACAVQVANALYEMGMVLYAILRAPPKWADSIYLTNIHHILQANRNTQEATGLFECPLCGRFTTSLSGGGTTSSPYRCRWCDDNRLNIPLPKDIVWGMKPTIEDTRAPLIIEVELPSKPDETSLDKVLLFWNILVRNGKGIIHSAFRESLNLLIEKGIVKRVKDTSKQSYYWDNPSKSSNTDPCLDEFGPIDFVKSGFYKLAYLSFEVAIPHDSTFRAPNGAVPVDGVFRAGYEDLCDFIKVNPPWRVDRHSEDIKALKTLDIYRFKVFVGIEFPLLDPSVLPNKDFCKHEFRLLDCGVWEWRLVWECKHCGYTCYCSCFKRAILASPYEKEFLHKYGKKINIRASELPFHDMVCEICREQPSTNQFCAEMYARSLFEVKYGAYVKKRMIELKLDGCNVSNERELEILADNLVRKELGFPAIGEKWITETELYRIIKSLFPDQEVIHHYRDKWLEGLELDIYIPEQRLGLEYHGEQHFMAVEAWGGKDGLERTRQRDIKKVNLCKDNAVDLIAFTYEEEIGPRHVKTKLVEMGCKFT
jgi:hypothetical protein